ncbi:hypothetical protein [Pontibacillus litoralis]|nr:hypothetical protein [Pontibacillus litoralis]
MNIRVKLYFSQHVLRNALLLYANVCFLVDGNGELPENRRITQTFDQ